MLIALPVRAAERSKPARFTNRSIAAPSGLSDGMTAGTGVHVTDASNQPELRLSTIVEVYRNFAPPSDLKSDVEMLLSYVPQKYFVGLKTIILTNKAGMTRDKRRQKVWSRNRKIILADALGSYSAATRSSPASVSLHVDNIVDSDPDWFRRLPVFGHGTLAHVLYHEIGHYIHRTTRPVLREKRTWQMIGAASFGGISVANTIAIFFRFSGS
jgi:hypothetical protein